MGMTTGCYRREQNKEHLKMMGVQNVILGQERISSPWLKLDSKL